MTKNETIQDLKYLIQNDDYGSLHKEAIELAIKALEQSPCESAVSRRKVFSAIHNTHLPKKYEEPLWNKISDLPSVTPIRPKKYWIPVGYDDYGDVCSYKCSECGEFSTYLDNFCCNCGADMKGEKDAT